MWAMNVSCSPGLPVPGSALWKSCKIHASSLVSEPSPTCLFISIRHSGVFFVELYVGCMTAHDHELVAICQLWAYRVAMRNAHIRCRRSVKVFKLLDILQCSIVPLEDLETRRTEIRDANSSPVRTARVGWHRLFTETNTMLNQLNVTCRLQCMYKVLPQPPANTDSTLYGCCRRKSL